MQNTQNLLIAQEVLIAGIVAIIGAAFAYGKLKAQVDQNKEDIDKLEDAVKKKTYY
ncbi:MAG: hypothetical protein F6K40_02520 [Okeania sp. SIO3I5]|uniref:hypothetical protein n=1 Tax=Okeania sp. SIO3I5 TaxID=2607805 RepID=UPI0013BBEF92|nr:hypothetical protein [Okeania sp. SIO3I5]NEQ35240.1 hypothetical protein [Okeania sp. SIO3I5]